MALICHKILQVLIAALFLGVTFAGKEVGLSVELHRVRRQSSSDVHGHCQVSEFPCGNSTECVLQSKHCDSVVDCANGADEDEEDCDDMDNTNNFDFLFGKKEDSEEQPPPVTCTDTIFPDECECFVVIDEESGLESDEPLGLQLDCQLSELESVPDNLPRDTIYLNFAGNLLSNITAETFKTLTKLTRLDLQSNRIGSLHPDSFRQLRSLELLDLSNNRISSISKEYFLFNGRLKELLLKHNPIQRLEDAELFINLQRLETLDFFGAQISELRTGVFSPLENLKKLVLAHNEIEALTQGNMEGLRNLLELDLQNNDVSFVEDGTFKEMPMLNELRLHGNKIHEVKQGMFEDLANLTILLLDQNMIHTIEPGSFSKLFKLQHITMSNNMLTHLTVGMFDGLSKVTSLSLYANKITEMENGTFEPLIKVLSLNLKDNLFRVVPRGIFDVMPMLGHIYFDHFFLCGFAPHVKDCDPKSDGLSTSEDLLGSIVLRVAVWLVSILASFGNLIVLFARCVSKDDNKVHSFFIINLAISDFLMGAYLFIVAVHDVMFRGVYILHDVDWRSSWVCQLCGAFSLLSSEMSVFTLTIITADRYFCIVHPFRFRSRNLIPAAILMGCLWIIGITLSILPLLHRSYFGDFFYGANGVCLPLQFDRPFDDGWVFSLFVFVVANLLSFTFIVWAYIRMFYTIRRSNLAARSTKVSQDYALLKRFTIIVATDFLCWMPIIIVKFVTYGGVAIPPAAHAWFAIFILPVNSALNPILYTMTTRQFKRMIFHPSRTFMGKQKSTAGHEMSQSMSRTRDREIGHTATSRLSVISHSNTMKNGTPTTPRNGHMENLSTDDKTNDEDRDQNMDSPE